MWIRGILYETVWKVPLYLTSVSYTLVVIGQIIGVIHASKDRAPTDTISKWQRALFILYTSTQFMSLADYWINIASSAIPEYPEWCDALVYCHI